MAINRSGVSCAGITGAASITASLQGGPPSLAIPAMVTNRKHSRYWPRKGVAVACFWWSSWVGKACGGRLLITGRIDASPEQHRRNFPPSSYHNEGNHQTASPAGSEQSGPFVFLGGIFAVVVGCSVGYQNLIFVELERETGFEAEFEFFASIGKSSKH
jgi:hypothetical protein